MNTPSAEGTRWSAVLTSVSGVEFAECWASRKEALLGGEPVWLPSLEDLRHLP
jgi:predicted phosphoadenosine phosphosulfate sulfurtransferase